MIYFMARCQESGTKQLTSNRVRAESPTREQRAPLFTLSVHERRKKTKGDASLVGRGTNQKSSGVRANL